MEPLSPGDPELIAGYRLLARLGAGGMGRVYLARSPGGRPVALKVIRSEYAEDEAFRTRFRREVAAARSVSGACTAPVLDADPDGDPAWLATAYVPGVPLDEAVTRFGPQPQAVGTLAAGLAEALVAVHDAGLVHRDLKPSNVILAPDGPRVIDFGIARAGNVTAVTRSGLLVGSLGFLAPEQADASKGSVGPATDVFAWACVIGHTAVGHGPFGSGEAFELLYRVVEGQPDLTGIPGPYAALVARCLDKNPAARPGTRELLAEVAAIRAHPGTAPEAAWLSEPLSELIVARSAALLADDPVAAHAAIEAAGGRRPGTTRLEPPAEESGPGEHPHTPPPARTEIVHPSRPHGDPAAAAEPGPPAGADPAGSRAGPPAPAPEPTQVAHPAAPPAPEPTEPTGPTGPTPEPTGLAHPAAPSDTPPASTAEPAPEPTGLAHPAAPAPPPPDRTGTRQESAPPGRVLEHGTTPPGPAEPPAPAGAAAPGPSGGPSVPSAPPPGGPAAPPAPPSRGPTGPTGPPGPPAPPAGSASGAPPGPPAPGRQPAGASGAPRRRRPPRRRRRAKVIAALVGVLVIAVGAAVLVPRVVDGGSAAAGRAPCGGFTANFAKGEDDPVLSRENPVKGASFTYAGGRLRITAPPGTDVRADRQGRVTAPYLSAPAKGNFTLETVVTVNPRAAYQGSGLLLYVDDRTYVRLERAYGSFNAIAFEYFANGRHVKQTSAYAGEGNAGLVRTTADQVSLQLKRNGGTVTAAWRPGDSGTWQRVPGTAPLSGNTRAGVTVSSNAAGAGPLTATFSGLAMACA